MKKLFILSLSVLIFGCGPSTNYQGDTGSTTISVQPASTTLGDNLDLQALGEIVKTSATAADIEQTLNKDGSINNIDLDGDGKVDYITVTEYPADAQSKGFSFTVDLGPKGKQEIATVEIQKNATNASMNIAGNQTIYGNNAVYSSNYSLSDLIILNYLWSSHPYYYSPYHYGYYPSYYHYGYCSPYNTYHSRMYSSYGKTTIKHTVTTTRVSKSPNSSASSSIVSTRSKSLSNPTSSQKSFSSRTSTSTPSTAGFKSKSSSSGSSYKSSSSSSRSFGSSSRSSGRSSGGRRR